MPFRCVFPGLRAWGPAPPRSRCRWGRPRAPLCTLSCSPHRPLLPSAAEQLGSPVPYLAPLFGCTARLSAIQATQAHDRSSQEEEPQEQQHQQQSSSSLLRPRRPQSPAEVAGRSKENKVYAAAPQELLQGRGLAAALAAMRRSTTCTRGGWRRDASHCATWRRRSCAGPHLYFARRSVFTLPHASPQSWRVLSGRLARPCPGRGAARSQATACTPRQVRLELVALGRWQRRPRRRRWR